MPVPEDFFGSLVWHHEPAAAFGAEAEAATGTVPELVWSGGDRDMPMMRGVAQMKARDVGV